MYIAGYMACTTWHAHTKAIRHRGLHEGVSRKVFTQAVIRYSMQQGYSMLVSICLAARRMMIDQQSERGRQIPLNWTER
jgi:hypothetical protein